MKRVCVVTGTRAEYGLLKPLIKKIDMDTELELVLVVTGMHLMKRFGYTITEIIQDGIRVDKQIEMPLENDTPKDVLESMAVELMGFANYFVENSIDLVVLLGDRYETFIAATAAMMFTIPIAHIHGGELTEGAIDDAIRHSISKMSMLHFAATEEYKKRIIQLGENPQNVFCVGALGVESIYKLELLSKEELRLKTGIDFGRRIALVTYHPVTLENSTLQEQFTNLLNALDKNKELYYIFTKSNSDVGGTVINEMIASFVAKRKDRTILFSSMGQLNYLSAMKYCDVVIGNSSSGIIEAPSFHIPTINVGSRQSGRTQAKSVINCGAGETEIEKAIKLALDNNFRKNLIKVKNPYYKENTSEEIIQQIKSFLDKEKNLKKIFYDK